MAFTGRYCVYCRRPEMRRHEHSARGMCSECGNKRMLDNIDAMASRQGPVAVEHMNATLAGVERAAARALRRSGMDPASVGNDPA